MELVLTSGQSLAVLGGAIAALFGGIGSSIGSGKAGEAAGAISSEKPELAGRLMILQALPGSQGIYGFVIAFMVASLEFTELTNVQGAQVLFACLPVALTGLFSGVYQGKVAVAGIKLVAKHVDKMGSAITFAVIVETFALLGLLASIMLLGTI